MSTSALHFTTLFDVGTGLPVGFDDAQTPVVADSPAVRQAILTTCHYRVRAALISARGWLTCSAAHDGQMICDRPWIDAHEMYELVTTPEREDSFLIKTFHGTFLRTGPDGIINAGVHEPASASCYRFGPTVSADLVKHVTSIKGLANLIRYNPAFARREIARFSVAAAILHDAGLPSIIIVGPGEEVRLDALHIEYDINPTLLQSGWLLENYGRFFVFRADDDCGIEPDTIDFIFHEDVFEHIDQKGQIRFLASAFRALKPGGVHRINTPCLRDSMRTHSDFLLGAKGVYTDEWDKWQHVSLVTQDILREYALIVGYDRCFFTVVGVSCSPHYVRDTRPGSDRDRYFGNVIAELIK